MVTMVLGGGGGVGWDPPSSKGPPKVPAEGGPKILKCKSSWNRKRRSKNLGCQPQTLKGEERGGGGGRVLLNGGGGVQGGWVGGAVGGTPPAQETLSCWRRRRNFWLKLTCAEGAREKFYCLRQCTSKRG